MLPNLSALSLQAANVAVDGEEDLPEMERRRREMIDRIGNPRAKEKLAAQRALEAESGKRSTFGIMDRKRPKEDLPELPPSAAERVLRDRELYNEIGLALLSDANAGDVCLRVERFCKALPTPCNVSIYQRACGWFGVTPEVLTIMQDEFGDIYQSAETMWKDTFVALCHALRGVRTYSRFSSPATKAPARNVGGGRRSDGYMGSKTVNTILNNVTTMHSWSLEFIKALINHYGSEWLVKRDRPRPLLAQQYFGNL